MESPIWIDGVRDAVIDFNHSIIRLPDAYAYEPEYERIAVGMKNCSNVLIKNLVIDGNRANNDGNDCIGLMINDCSNVQIIGANIHDVIHHGVWVSSNTPGTRFDDLVVEDNYGHERAADIYISNNASDTVEFHGVTATREGHHGNQVFYVNGYNTLIEDCNFHGIHGRAVDYRKGAHVLRRVEAVECANVLVVNGAEVDLVAEDIRAIKCDTENNLNEVVRFTGCKRARLSNIHAECDPDDWKYYCLRLSAASPGDIQDVLITNLTCINAQFASIYMTGLDTSVVIDGCIIDSKASAYTLYIDTSCNQPQYIRGLNVIGSHNGVHDPAGLAVIT